MAKSKFRWIKWLSIATLLMILLATSAVFGTIYYFSRDLPSLDLLQSYEPSLATRVYSDDKRSIGQFYIEKRIFVPLSKMPKVMIQAILAVEDSRFYEHKGFDLLRMLKATLTNLESMKIRQGASTITQQLTRSLFLTPEKTMQRKFKEILLARKIELMLTKDQILEIYLNQIYFGHGAYGVQIASRTYFGKDAEKLSLSEAAFLAGLPKAPNNYSPYLHPDRARTRKEVVLKRMVEEKFITEETYQNAIKETLDFEKLHPEEDLALYFLESIRQYLAARYGDDTVYKGGLNVYTTLNISMQRMANRAMTTGLHELDKRQGYRKGAFINWEASSSEEEPQVGDILEGRVLNVGNKFATVEAGGIIGRILLDDMLWAIGKSPEEAEGSGETRRPADLLRPKERVLLKLQRMSLDAKQVFFSLEQEPEVEGAFIALDPTTGGVKAMVGGYNFKRSEYNRALSARRQPGSAFKPIIYATAIERGFTPASIIVDNPVIFADQSSDRVWKPRNYEEKFYGPIRLREALAHSRNLATIKLLDQVGIDRVIDLARRVGIQSPLTRDLSLGLGSSGVSLIELTSAYGVFANQGVRATPYFISKVTDHNHALLEEHRTAAQQSVSADTAYLITNLLEEVIASGTGRRAAVLGRPIAGKTGTTNEYTDAWFVGYSPQLVAGVWVGFDTNRPLGGKESGASAALPIWISFMQAALKRYPAIPFPIPDNIVYAKIDAETGLLAPPEGNQGITEVFIRGTEPKTYKNENASPSDFFRLDAEGDGF